MEHHPTLSPSSFPSFALCACFTSGGGNSATERGSAQHELLEHCLKSGFTKVGMAKGEFTKPVDTLGLAEVQYGLEYVLDNTTAHREVEIKLSLIGEDFETITYGHADVVEKIDKEHWQDVEEESCILIDYKSGEYHEYKRQMLVYARMAMDKYGVNTCKVVELYGRKRTAKEYTVSYEETQEVLDIIARVNDPERKPQPCEKCSWCSKFKSCEAVVQHVTTGVVEYNERKGAEDPKFKDKEYVVNLGERLANYDAKAVDDPKQMQLMLELVPVIKKWADSIKQHIEGKMIKDGVSVDGWKVVEKSSESLSKDDTLAIYHASQLSPEKFTECCTVAVGKLRAAVVEHADIKTKAGSFVGANTKGAKVEFAKRFGGLIVSNQSKSVKKVS